MLRKLNNNHIKIIIKHGLVSITSATVETILFKIFYSEEKYILAYIVSFGIATSFGYIGHTFLTFSVNKISFGTMKKYVIQISISLILGISITKALIINGFEPVTAKVVQLMIGFSFNVIFGYMVSFKK